MITGRIVFLSSCACLALAACQPPQSYPLGSGYQYHTAPHTGSNVEPGVVPPDMGFDHRGPARIEALWARVAHDLLDRSSISSPRGAAVAVVLPAGQDSSGAGRALYVHLDNALRTELRARGYRLVPVGDAAAAVTLTPYARLAPLSAWPADPEARGENDHYVITLAAAQGEARDVAQGTYALPSYALGPPQAARYETGDSRRSPFTW